MTFWSEMPRNTRIPPECSPSPGLAPKVEMPAEQLLREAVLSRQAPGPSSPHYPPHPRLILRFGWKEETTEGSKEGEECHPQRVGSGSWGHRTESRSHGCMAGPEFSINLLDSKAISSVPCRSERVIKKNIHGVSVVGIPPSQEVFKQRDPISTSPASESMLVLLALLPALRLCNPACL